MNGHRLEQNMALLKSKTTVKLMSVPYGQYIYLYMPFTPLFLEALSAQSWRFRQTTTQAVLQSKHELEAPRPSFQWSHIEKAKAR